MNIIGVIPARLASRRLPQKLLIEVEGKPLIQWTWENANQARMLDKLIIACDSEEIKKVAEEFGAEVVMTSSQHKSGTDRIAEAVSEVEVKIVINIQADEPLLQPVVIDSLCSCMLGSKELVMATVKKKITDPKEIEDTSVVKVITDKNDFAIYFSRYPLPFLRNKDREVPYYKHIGIYAYTKEFLYTFKNLPFSYLEYAEHLEQLRAIEAGYKIKVIETKFDSWGVDTPYDLEKVRSILSVKTNV